MSIKVAIYCRLSEEDKNKQFESDDSGSIQNQKSMLLQYAMEQGWELYMDRAKGIISESDYVKMAREFATGRKRLERVITDGQKQLSEIEEKQAYSRHKGRSD